MTQMRPSASSEAEIHPLRVSRAGAGWETIGGSVRARTKDLGSPGHGKLGRR